MDRGSKRRISLNKSQMLNRDCTPWPERFCSGRILQRSCLENSRTRYSRFHCCAPVLADGHHNTYCTSRTYPLTQAPNSRRWPISSEGSAELSKLSDQQGMRDGLAHLPCEAAERPDQREPTDRESQDARTTCAHFAGAFQSLRSPCPPPTVAGRKLLLFRARPGVDWPGPCRTSDTWG